MTRGTLILGVRGDTALGRVVQFNTRTGTSDIPDADISPDLALWARLTTEGLHSPWPAFELFYADKQREGRTTKTALQTLRQMPAPVANARAQLTLAVEGIR